MLGHNAHNGYNAHVARWLANLAVVNAQIDANGLPAQRIARMRSGRPKPG